MLALVDFPKQIVIALAVTVKYMKGQSNYTAVYISQLTIRTPAFGLENAFRNRSSFTRFVNSAHMLLSSNTLVNLSVYCCLEVCHSTPPTGRCTETRRTAGCTGVSCGVSPVSRLMCGADVFNSAGSVRRAMFSATSRADWCAVQRQRWGED